MVAKRSELADQQRSLSSRRNELSEQHARADLTTRRDLESRMKMLDDRSARLEREILQADDAIADALARGVLGQQRREASTTVPPRNTDFPPGNVIANFALFNVLAFALLGVALWRLVWKRAQGKFARPTLDQSSRFDQLQQAVDVIALEVERISEGQRYVTKVLNENLQPALGAGEAQHIPAKDKSAAPARTADGSA